MIVWVGRLKGTVDFERHFPNDTELALGMTLLNCNGSYKFSVSVKKMGERLST